MIPQTGGPNPLEHRTRLHKPRLDEETVPRTMKYPALTELLIDEMKF